MRTTHDKGLRAGRPRKGTGGTRSPSGARDPVADGLARADSRGEPEPAFDRTRPAATPPRPKVPRATAGGALMAVAFAGIHLLIRAAVRIYFHRVRVRHRVRFPRRGPVLVVANHPAMWTDVLVLDAGLGRKLHFLAQEELFRPRLRGWLLEVHGALPLVQSAGRTGRERNDLTFETCRRLFRRGEVVALFPEGVSEADRQVLPLKTGAARLALAATRGDPGEREPVLLPVGMHYADRTAFGSDVTLSVGEALSLGPFHARASADPEGAVHALTDAMHEALRALTLDLPEPALAAAVADLEPLAGLSPVRGAGELESAQRIASRLHRLSVTEPARFAAVRRHRHAYRRARRALRLSDRAIHWDRHTARWRQRTFVLAMLVGLGAVPALVGAVVHVVPWAIGESVARSVGRDPARFSFGRISSGIVFFPALYVLVLGALTHGWGIPLGPALLGVVAVAVLGLWAIQVARWARALFERARRLVLEWRRPALVRRAREAQRALLDVLAEAASPEPGDRGSMPGNGRRGGTP
jgi:glycerol-3-phosphate O-acyltransferase/dihydroxyacetone phosphate acyltransferase